jgi:hypothetical protein
MLAVDEANPSLQTPLAIEFHGHRINVGPVELGDLRRWIAPENGHAKNARTSGDIQNPQSFSVRSDAQNIAQRLGNGLGNRNDADNELFPDHEFIASVHPTEGFAGFEGFLKICHTVPERQRDVTEVPHISRLTFDEESFTDRQEIVAPVFLLDQRRSDETIENDARCPRVRTGLASDFIGGLKAFVDQGKKIILDRGVENLAIGEIPENSHQRTGGYLFLGFALLGHATLCTVLPS